MGDAWSQTHLDGERVDLVLVHPLPAPTHEHLRIQDGHPERGECGGDVVPVTKDSKERRGKERKGKERKGRRGREGEEGKERKRKERRAVMHVCQQTK